MKALAVAAAIKVLTFNAAGIPLVHPELARRVSATGRAIKDGGYDLVGLQELWGDKDHDRVAALSGLPYAARVRRTIAFGSGLSILSRWPILKTEERAFTAVRPSLRHPLEGEFLARKGWLFARVATPGGPLDVYAAHTLADYPEAQYHLIRLTELFELAEGIRELSGTAPFVVLADLNSGRGDAEFDLFMDLLGARDACEKDGRELCPEAGRTRRIDHALSPGLFAGPGRKVLDAPLDSSGLTLSDHAGFEAALRLPAKPSALAAPRRAAALAAVSDAMTAAIARLEERRRSAGWIPVYGAFVSARYERQMRRFEAVRERADAAR